jgi:hypothetical protein
VDTKSWDLIEVHGVLTFFGGYSIIGVLGDCLSALDWLSLSFQPGRTAYSRSPWGCVSGFAPEEMISAGIKEGGNTLRLRGRTRS